MDEQTNTPSGAANNAAANAPIAQATAVSPVVAVEKSPTIRIIEKLTVWIMVLSTIAFAFISILAIWHVLGNSGDVVGRSMGTVCVIAFAALVVNIGANILDHSKKK